MSAGPAGGSDRNFRSDALEKWSTHNWICSLLQKAVNMGWLSIKIWAQNHPIMGSERMSSSASGIDEVIGCVLFHLNGIAIPMPNVKIAGFFEYSIEHSSGNHACLASG
jgi:hypothetical protein